MFKIFNWIIKFLACFLFLFIIFLHIFCVSWYGVRTETIDVKRQSSKELILLVCQQVLLMCLWWQTVSDTELRASVLTSRTSLIENMNFQQALQGLLWRLIFFFFFLAKGRVSVLWRNRTSGGDDCLINLHRKSGTEENEIVIWIGSIDNGELKAVHFFFQH